MNLKLLAGVDYSHAEKKNLKSFHLQKQAFLANNRHQCFACCARKNHQIGNIFGSLHRRFNTLSLSPEKERKNGKIEMLSYTFSMQVRKFKTA